MMDAERTASQRRMATLRDQMHRKDKSQVKPSTATTDGQMVLIIREFSSQAEEHHPQDGPCNVERNDRAQLSMSLQCMYGHHGTLWMALTTMQSLARTQGIVSDC